jgi:hypothetical protein
MREGEPVVDALRLVPWMTLVPLVRGYMRLD